MNEIFLYATRKRNIRQNEIEKEGITALCLLHDFLLEKKIGNIGELLREARMLTIFLNNYSREALVATFNNERLKILAANLIGLVTYLTKCDNDSSYHFGGVSRLLEKELNNGDSQEIYVATTPYFEILLISKTFFQKDFWATLDLFHSDEGLSIFSTEEYVNLVKYKNLIKANQLSLTKIHLRQIEMIWEDILRDYEIIDKIKLQYAIYTLYDDLNTFRKSYISSSKYNIYLLEREKAFHKNIYPFFTQREYDLVLSEMTAGDDRHDIILYNREKSMSAIIELKVNDLRFLNDNIEQLVDYLAKVKDRHNLYIETPTVGALVIYYIGAIDSVDQIRLDEIVPERQLKKHSSNFYLYSPNGAAPILIALFNGKN